MRRHNNAAWLMSEVARLALFARSLRRQTHRMIPAKGSRVKKGLAAGSASLRTVRAIDRYLSDLAIAL